MRSSALCLGCIAGPYCRRRYRPAAYIYAVCLNRQALLCPEKGKIMNPYKEEIIHAHAAIENWLSKGMGSTAGVDSAFRC